MASRAQGRILIIGAGNEYRCDDAVGIHVAQVLQKDCIDEIDVVVTSGEGTGLLDLWQDRDTVFVVDAMLSGRAAGAILRLEAGVQDLPTGLSPASSHAFGIAEAVEMGRTLSLIPAELIIYAVEGACFDTGTTMSTPVRQAVPVVVRQIMAEIPSKITPT